MTGLATSVDSLGRGDRARKSFWPRTQHLAPVACASRASGSVSPVQPLQGKPNAFCIVGDRYGSGAGGGVSTRVGGAAAVCDADRAEAAGDGSGAAAGRARAGADAGAGV